MATRTFDGNRRDAREDDTDGPGRPEEADGEGRSPLIQDPITGLLWTETLLPLLTNWAGSSAVHAVCLHFAGLGILANRPEYQTSPSLLHEAAERLTRLVEEDDRLTRFSGNKLLIFSKRPEAAVRQLLVDIADELDSFGAEVDGRRLPDIRVGVAMVGGRGTGAVTVEAMNRLMNDAAGTTIPISEIVTPRHKPSEPAGSLPPETPMPPRIQAAPTRHVPEAEPIAANAMPPTEARSAPAPAPGTPAERSAPSSPEVPHHILGAEGEKETTMINRGYHERTPIRPVPEVHAPTAAQKTVPAPDSRLVLKGVDVAVTGLVATATIELELDGRAVRGKAIGRSADGHPVALVGEAMTRAVTDLLPAGHGTVFRQALPTATDAGDVIVTVVEFLTPDRTEVLFGVAPTEGEPVAGVARSILDAVNRRTSRLLEPAG
jgi:hypothetical protein